MSLEKMSEDVVVYYDLETTDAKPRAVPKHKGVQILSIGAINGRTGEEFLKYSMPTCPINPEAAKKNHFAISDGKLTLRGVPVRAGDPAEVLKHFMTWLEEQDCKWLVSN